MEENDRHVTFSCCLKKQGFGGLFPVEFYTSLITNLGSPIAGEEKEPFEQMARADQKRYKEAMAGYKNAPANDSGDD